jgi:hypothetical protein
MALLRRPSIGACALHATRPSLCSTTASCGRKRTSNAKNGTQDVRDGAGRSRTYGAVGYTT